MELSPEQDERLSQWRNVYGSPEKCVRAARSDARIQSLLELELAIEPMPQSARAIRERIISIEACHERCKRNTEDILRMIGAMKPESILSCGEVSPEVAAELRATIASAAAWADGKPEEAGEWGDILGEPSPEKRWLVACLCKTLAKQLEHCQGTDPLPQPEWPSQ